MYTTLSPPLVPLVPVLVFRPINLKLLFPGEVKKLVGFSFLAQPSTGTGDEGVGVVVVTVVLVVVLVVVL